MKKRHNIKFKALLLLLTYLFSNSPSILFHHHKLEITAYEKATPCEKAIYYSDEGKHCNHKTHISKAHEKCFLCDNHTVSPHSPQSFFDFFFTIVESTDYSDNVKNYFFLTPSTFSNRGPPSVSSFTV